MSTPSERAQHRIERLRSVNPRAVELARYASLAVRVDAPLLRRLRLKLLAGSDASAEADLWFSELTESRGSEGFVLHASVVEILRAELARERLPDGTSALDAAHRWTAQMHAAWPEELRIEEDVTFYALRNAAGDAESIAERLKPALKTIADEPARGVEVARWAVRAMPRLPEGARGSDAAVALVVASIARIGGGANVLPARAESALPVDLGWLLTGAALHERTQLVLDLFDDGLVFRTPSAEDDATQRLDLPRTRPLIVELTWQVLGTPGARIAAVEFGRKVELPVGWTALHVRALTGETYRVVRRLPAAPVDRLEWLSSACVSIHRTDLRGSAVGVGFFVLRGRVLTSSHVLAPRADSGLVQIPWSESQSQSNVAESIPTFAIRFRDLAHEATVVARDPDSDLALLGVDESIDGVLALPRRLGGLAIGESWSTLAFQRDAQKIIEGTVLASRAGNLGPEREVRIARIEALISTPNQDAILRGAPLLVGDEVAGVVQTKRHTLSNSGSVTIDATGMPTLERFLRWALRPMEHDPDVFIDRIESSEGYELTQELIELVRDARLRSFDFTSAPGSNYAETIEQMNGVLLLRGPDDFHAFEAEMLALPYKRWADPAFPCLTLTWGTSNRGSQPPRGHAPIVNMDSLGREQLIRLLRETFDGDDAPHNVRFDDRRFRATVEAEFRRLVPSGDNIDPTLADIELRGLGKWSSLVLECARRAWSIEADAQRQRTSSDLVMPPGSFEFPGVVGVEVPRAFVERCTMLALPSGETLERLRSAARSSSEHRAVCINARPVQIAHLLLAKAWHPLPPPAAIDIRDQQWPHLSALASIRTKVVVEVRAVLDCDDDEAEWLIDNSTTPFFVVFATRPLPARETVEELRRLLPHAVFFFMAGEGAIDEERARAAGITPLPPLREDQGMRLIAEYERLLDEVAPRTPNAPAPAPLLTNERLDEEELARLRLALDVRNVDLAALMTPRSQIVAVDVADGVAGAIRASTASSHNRIPVYDGNIDLIIGYVVRSELESPDALSSSSSGDLRARLRTAFFTSETRQPSALLDEFNSFGERFAIVLKKEGGTAGLVTLTDLLRAAGVRTEDSAKKASAPPRAPVSDPFAELAAHMAALKDRLDPRWFGATRDFDRARDVEDALRVVHDRFASLELLVRELQFPVRTRERGLGRRKGLAWRTRGTSRPPGAIVHELNRCMSTLNAGIEALERMFPAQARELSRHAEAVTKGVLAVMRIEQPNSVPNPLPEEPSDPRNKTAKARPRQTSNSKSRSSSQANPEPKTRRRKAATKKKGARKKRK